MNDKYDLTEYVDKLYTVALGKVGDTHVAEDIVQETFLAALQTLAKGKEIENVWSWLLAILSNKHCDWLREKYNKPQISFEEYPFDIPEEEAESDDTSEKLEVIHRELGYLAQMHREVMVRFYMRGESIEKIARDLNIPVGTVKSRLNTGRTQVKKGVNMMENYTKQSYDPDTLMITCSGMQGFNYEPFSLVKENDKLTQSILILAYEKPISTTDLAKALGVPAVFVEPIVEKMVNYEKEYIKWIYELYCNVPTEESQVGDYVFAAVDSFLKNGILKQENGLLFEGVDYPIPASVLVVGK